MFKASFAVFVLYSAYSGGGGIGGEVQPLDSQKKLASTRGWVFGKSIREREEGTSKITGATPKRESSAHVIAY